MKTKRLATIFAFAALLTAAKAADEATALGVLASADSDLHAKAMACDELGRVGTAKAVPALAKLLPDEKLHDYARDGLERIKDPTAGKALLDGLNSLKGSLRVGVIMSLGDRREEAAVPELTKIVMNQSADKDAVSAALISLSRIASYQAGRVIMKVLKEGSPDAKGVAAHAALAVAQQMDKGDQSDIANKLREAAKLEGIPAGATK